MVRRALAFTQRIESHRLPNDLTRGAVPIAPELGRHHGGVGGPAHGSGNLRGLRLYERRRAEGAADYVAGDVDQQKVVVAGVVAQRRKRPFHVDA